MALGFWPLFRRYCLVTLLPAGVAYSIYADYTRTQLYQAKLKRDNAEAHYS